jgi:negative regulator of flagellin synthesis FlgM
MEINSVGPNEIGSAYSSEVQGSRTRSKAAQPGGSTGAGPAGELRLSDEAQALRKALEAAADAPEVRTELVKKFREAIANGTYQPDPEQIADRLLQGLQ